MNKNLFFAILILLSFGFSVRALQAEEVVKPIKQEVQQKDEAVVDEKAVEEPVGRPLSEVASGVKEVGTSPGEFVHSTVDETRSGPPIVGTLKGIERGAGELTRSAVKGVSNIVTLGHGQQTELEPSAVGTDHKDPAKFKIKIPGS